MLEVQITTRTVSFLFLLFDDDDDDDDDEDDDDDYDNPFGRTDRRTDIVKYRDAQKHLKTPVTLSQDIDGYIFYDDRQSVDGCAHLTKPSLHNQKSEERSYV